MPVQLHKAQTLGGVTYPAGIVITGLSARQEEQLAQGGDATRMQSVPAGVPVVALSGGVPPTSAPGTGYVLTVGPYVITTGG